jgi:peptidoglycan/LPS O-acetylase OafA/YrhL
VAYRAEIDGLRAVAVASVILYHAELIILGYDWFTGGFVGVDVFFVISGYFISKIILSELSRSGTINIRDFYIRRARRILPAFLTVVIASLPFAYKYLAPDDLRNYSESILSSLAFISNFYFYFTSTEYGAAPGLLMPFLHTWSLSVEEQFYILFPVTAWAAFRYRAGRVAPTVACLLVSSFVLCLVLQTSDRQLAFFLPFTRAWELLAGTLLALHELKNGRSEKSKLGDALGYFGILLILASVTSLGHTSDHPGLITLLPVLGACLIIAFSHADRGVGIILGSPLARGAGLISYSLYLWHYPIFAFGRITSIEFDNTDKASAIAITLLLSIATYLLIERPFRHSNRSRIVMIGIGALTITSASAASAAILLAGLPHRIHSVYPAIAAAREAKARSEFKNFVGDRSLQKPGCSCARGLARPKLVGGPQSLSGSPSI